MSMHTTRVRGAFKALQELLPAYYDKLLLSRAGLINGSINPDAAGSIYPGFSPETLPTLIAQEEWQPYDHPDIAPGCFGFRAEHGDRAIGLMGVVDLWAYTYASITLEDPKNTGFVEAYVRCTSRHIVTFTTAILGNEGGREVVFTFHPGDPISPSRVPAKDNIGRKVTRDDCIAMGLRYGKVVAT